MKKIKHLLPLATIGSVAAITTPLITSCGGGISWDFVKKGKYVNKKIVPLPLGEQDPTNKAYEFLAKDKNNIIYDDLLDANKIIETQKEEGNKFSIKTKIDSYDSITHTISFSIDLEQDVSYKTLSSTISDIAIAHLKCKDILIEVVNLNEDSNLYKNLGKNPWYLGTNITKAVMLEDDEQVKTILASQESNGQITGTYYCFHGVKFSSINSYEYFDDNCNYNKSTLDSLFEDTAKGYCLLESYEILVHRMYYLDNYQEE